MGRDAASYRTYVGPSEQYDFMGATQFRLLTTLGLREHHSVLDFGCGSLRAGRLLIPYLLPGRYYGLEPNRKTLENFLKHHHSQGLSSRLVTPEELFHPSTHETFKV